MGQEKGAPMTIDWMSALIANAVFFGTLVAMVAWIKFLTWASTPQDDGR
jgi:hypothetical protein